MLRLSLLVVVACGSSTSVPKQQPPTADPKPVAMGAITVDLASVSLAEDCGTNAKPADPVIAPPTHRKPQPPQAPKASQPPGAPASNSGGYHAGERACEQTTMQLSIKAEGAGTISIKRVELLDASGKLVGTLTPRSPSTWTGGDYQPWDERVAAGQNLTASYALSAPEWSKLPGGRDPSLQLRVRVTVGVGNEERTLDKAAVVEGPALPMPEGVVT